MALFLCAQHGRDSGGGSVERNREPIDKNRIRGGAELGEQARDCEALVVKAQAA